MKMKIYLDYNATAPIKPSVIDRMADVMRIPGNASSVHGFGRDAKRVVEDARAEVAALVGVKPNQVVFNAGATEGNNTILSGYQDKRVLVSAVEHPSVLEAAPKAERIPVTKDGVVDLKALEDLLKTPAALVCVQLVNSETGVVQPVAEAAALAKKAGALFLCDAVQGAGRIEIDLTKLNVDYLTLSAHKMGGPQGVGALIFRSGLQMPKLMKGGGQERRQRAGTENIAGIAGFGVAAREALEEMAAYTQRTRAFQLKFEMAIRESAPPAIVYGVNAPRVSNTSNIGLPGIPAETQLMAMDLEGIAVSSGSACSSGSFQPSHVLQAMGFEGDAAKCALRFSTGWATTDAEIDAAIKAWQKMAARLMK